MRRGFLGLDDGFGLLSFSGRLLGFGVSFAHRFATSGWFANISLICALLLNGILRLLWCLFTGHRAHAGLLFFLGFGNFCSQFCNLLLEFSGTLVIGFSGSFQFIGQVQVLLHQGFHAVAFFCQIRDIGAVDLACAFALVISTLFDILNGQASIDQITLVDLCAYLSGLAAFVSIVDNLQCVQGFKNADT